VLGSPFFSGFASAVPAVVRSVHPAWMPDPKRLLEPHESFCGHSCREGCSP
jgi:hypothetical protein